MKILILGAGQVGSSAAYHLSREEANEVTVVDMRPEVLRELQDRLDIRTVVGHAAYPEVLERAGVRARFAQAVGHAVAAGRREGHADLVGRVGHVLVRIEHPHVDGIAGFDLIVGPEFAQRDIPAFPLLKFQPGADRPPLALIEGPVAAGGRAAGQDVVLYAIGKKGADYFRKRDYTVFASHVDFGGEANSERGNTVGNNAVDCQVAGEDLPEGGCAPVQSSAASLELGASGTRYIQVHLGPDRDQALPRLTIRRW